MLRSFNPIIAKTITVWAFPLSIATTQGITVLFSLPPGTKMFQFSGFASRLLRMSRLQRDGLPHSETCGYNGYLLLPAAYRSLSRPSSPLRAKAFAMRPFLLFSNIILLIFLVCCQYVKEPFWVWSLEWLKFEVTPTDKLKIFYIKSEEAA